MGTGEARADSDLDIFVALEGNWFQRRLYIIDGIAIDLFLDCAPHISEQLKPTGENVIIHNYATGWIAFDPRGLVRAWKQMARNTLAKPTPAREGDAFFHSVRIYNTLSSLMKHDECDEATRSFRLYQFLQACLQSLYSKHMRWKTTKNELHELRSFAPEESMLIETLLDPAIEFERKVKLATSLAQKASPAVNLTALEGPKWFLRPPPTIARINDSKIVLNP